MDRVIKFRIWSKKHKVMGEIKEMDIEKKFGLFRFKDYFLCLKFDEIESMQYTGLKDKNGKEIYEGDVVIAKRLSGFDCEDEYEEAHANDNENAGEGLTYYGNPCVVEFEDGEFWPREHYENCDDGFYSGRTFDLKVIGNIYENPGLIK